MLGLAGVGVVDDGATAKVVVGDAGEVVLVVFDFDDLLERIVGVAGPDQGLVADGVELFDGGDEFAHVAVAVLLVAVGITHDGFELQLPCPVGTKAIGNAGDGAVRNRGLGAAVEHVIHHAGGLHAVEGGVEDGVAAFGFGYGVVLFDGAADEVEDGAAGDAHAVDGSAVLTGEERDVFLGLDDALDAVGEEQGFDRVFEYAGGVAVDVLGERIRHGGLGVVGEADGGLTAALLIRAGERAGAADRVVDVAGLLGVEVGGGFNLAVFVVVAGGAAVAEAVGYTGGVGGDDGVKVVVEGIALAVDVDRVGDALEVAVDVVGEVGDGSLAVGEGAGNLGDVAGGAVEAGAAAAHQSGIANDVNAERDANEVTAGATRSGIAVVDEGFYIVGRTAVTRIEEAGDVAQRVVVVQGVGGFAKDGLAFKEAIVGANELREQGGGGAGGIPCPAGGYVLEDVGLFGFQVRAGGGVSGEFALEEAF